jgi:hypothetical protein
MSAVQRPYFGAAAAKLRPARSGGRDGAFVPVGRVRFFGPRRQPCKKPAFRISRATRFLEQRTPEALRARGMDTRAATEIRRLLLWISLIFLGERRVFSVSFGGRAVLPTLE